ncbi:DUF6894 family protein [Mesorhizobium sp. ASY16-5R]|uniref:DUF6894 family protein n=1 Tax=Mesorhizobium sp. ASY16-5R TaxID=3445772 RepID=UPI003FA18BF3
MPRYYFDLFDGEDISRDEVGIDLDHQGMAADHAVAARHEVGCLKRADIPRSPCCPGTG